jgi:hypothetical protein
MISVHIVPLCLRREYGGALFANFVLIKLAVGVCRPMLVFFII